MSATALGVSGTVRSFKAEKGYGFIQAASGEDVFVHFSNIIKDGYKSLNEGDRVTFEIEKSPKGFSALNVQVVEQNGPRVRPIPRNKR